MPSLLPAPPLLQFLWQDMKLDVPATACTSQAQQTHTGDAADKTGILGRHCDVSPCLSLKNGGQWNTLPYWQGFRC